VPRWRLAVVSIVAVTTIAVVAMVVTGMGPRLVLAIGLGLVVGVVVWLLVALAAWCAPAPPWDSVPDSAGDERDGRFAAMPTRYRIPSGPHDQRLAEQLRIRLLELMDDRLVTNHGIDRDRDPDAARQLMGADLAALADDPATARSLTNLANVDRAMSRIEAL